MKTYQVSVTFVMQSENNPIEWSAAALNGLIIEAVAEDVAHLWERWDLQSDAMPITINTTELVPIDQTNRGDINS